MSEYNKYSFRPPLYHREREILRDDQSTKQGERSSRSAEQQGWDAYRKWLSRVGARPARDRSPIDHSLYSWKGYNMWANRVKQSWKPDDSDT